jgi:glycosyltransferase involved in cell wall biosynthesis
VSGRLILDVRGGTLPAAAVAELLQAADVYVSPYRAEGFNLPVLEAAACGLPLVITAGGAADEFTDAAFARRVAAARAVSDAADTHALLRARGQHLEPDHEDLVAAILEAVRDAGWRAAAGRAAAEWVRSRGYVWRDVAAAHLRELGIDG